MGQPAKFSIQNFFANILILPVGLVTSVIIARQLGPEDKGIYNYFAILVYTIVPILLIGTGGATIYYLSSKKYKIKDVFFTNFLLSVFHGCLSALVIVSMYSMNLLGESLKDTSIKVIYLLLATVLFHAFYLLMSQILMALSKFPLLNKISIAKSILSLISFYTILYIYRLGLLEVLMSMLVILILLDVFLFVYFIKQFRPTLTIRVDYIKKLYQFGTKVWVGNMANQANSQLDQLMLGFMTSPANLGIYTVGYRLGSIVNLPISAIFAVFYNVIAAEKDKEKQRLTLFKVHRVSFSISIIMAIGLVLVGPFLIRLLYGAEFEKASLVLIIVMPGIVLYGITRRLVQKYFTARGQPTISSIIEVSGALLSLLFYAILIPEFQLFGAAIATTLGYFGSTIVSIFYLGKKNKLNLKEFFIIKITDINWFMNSIKGALVK